jgi:siroheme synthase (precorrin-2 oxidase/ferrochelatase)
MDYLPVFLQLDKQPVVVVGGGRVAARKVELLRRTLSPSSLLRASSSTFLGFSPKHISTVP